MAMSSHKIIVLAMLVACLELTSSLITSRAVNWSEGGEYILQCQLNGAADATQITWTYPAQEDRVTIVPAGSVSRLTVRNARIEDAGDYECRHTSAVIVRYTVSVSGIPAFVANQPTAFSVYEGGDLVLPCQVRHCSGNCFVHWKRNTHSVNSVPSTQGAITTESLTLRNVQQANSGSYICSISRLDTKLEFTVSVIPANERVPMLNKSIDNQYKEFDYNQALVLTCPLRSGENSTENPITVTWVFTNVHDQPQFVYGTVLTLEPEFYNRGEYKCTASNSFGLDSLDIFVEINGDITQSQSRDDNEITVNCVSFGNGEIEIRVVSLHADGSNDTETFVDEPISSTVATFTVTPSVEKAAYCEVGGMSTDLVYFGAIPVLEPTVTRLLAIVESVLTLECPYELGTASDHIHPYHHIWFNTDNSNVAIPEEFNRILNASVSKQSPNVSTYTCALRMQECSACASVVEYPSLNRPQFQLTKVVPLSIDVALVTRNVSAGSPATFECAANGTSIEIIWMYNGDSYTADDGNVTTSRIDSPYVRSILKLSSPSSNGSVICIVCQLFDGTVSSLNNNDFSNSLPEQIMNSTAELIVIPGTTSPTTMRTTSATTLPTISTAGM